MASYSERIQALSNTEFRQEYVKQNQPGPLSGGFFGRKRSLLEREAARRAGETAQTVFDMMDSQVASMRAAATSPEDLAIVANFDARAQYARLTGDTSNTDKFLDLGARWLQDQETQRLAAEAQATAQDNLRTDRSLAADKLRFDRDMALSSDLRQQVVNPYTQQMASFNKAQQLLNTGDRLGYDFAFTMAIQALDGSVVREGERMAYTGSSGLTAQMVDTYNKWKGEQTPELEAQLRRAIAATHNGVVESYREAVDTYKSQTEAYGGDWSRVGSVVPNLEDWEQPATIDRPPAEPAPSNPVEDAGLMGAAGARTLWNQIPDTVKQGAGLGAVLSLPKLVKAAASRTGLVGAAGGLLAWLAGENAQAVQQIRVRREGETDDQYRNRVARELTERSGSPFITPDIIRLPEEGPITQTWDDRGGLP